MPVDERGRVCLAPGETVVFHIREWRMARVNVAPAGATQPIFQNALVLQLDEVDGQAQEAEYRVTSEKLAWMLQPLLDSGAYKGMSMMISAQGEGRLRQFGFTTMRR